MKSTMDVINAAKKISEAGTKLDKLSRTILDMVGSTFIICTLDIKNMLNPLNSMS